MAESCLSPHCWGLCGMKLSALPRPFVSVSTLCSGHRSWQVQEGQGNSLWTDSSRVVLEPKLSKGFQLELLGPPAVTVPAEASAMKASSLSAVVSAVVSSLTWCFTGSRSKWAPWLSAGPHFGHLITGAQL